MNALVVYHSEFGNTRQVAEAIAETFDEVGTARTASAEQLEAADLQGVDLVVMGHANPQDEPAPGCPAYFRATAPA